MLANYTRQLMYIAENPLVDEIKKKEVICECLELGFPLVETLKIAKITYPEYIYMFYPDPSLETHYLLYDNRTSLGFVQGEVVDVITEPGIYSLQYKISDELGFYSEMGFIIYWDNSFRFLEKPEVAGWVKMINRNIKLNNILK